MQAMQQQHMQDASSLALAETWGPLGPVPGIGWVQVRRTNSSSQLFGLGQNDGLAPGSKIWQSRIVQLSSWCSDIKIGLYWGRPASLSWVGTN